MARSWPTRNRPDWCSRRLFGRSRRRRPRPVAYVWKTEEKGSDVNLGVHLVRDAFLKTYEAAAILTNDTDLEEPIRIVAQELQLHTVLLTPTNKPSTSLSRLAHSVRHIDPYLGPCHLLRRSSRGTAS